MVIPVAPHHCGSLFYWTRCLRMYFVLCSLFIMSLASATMAMTTIPLVTVVCSSTSSILTTATMAPSSMGRPVTSGHHDVVLPPPLTLRNSKCCWPCHCTIALTSVSDASSSLCQLCHGSFAGRFLFQI